LYSISDALVLGMPTPTIGPPVLSPAPKALEGVPAGVLAAPVVDVPNGVAALDPGAVDPGAVDPGAVVVAGWLVVPAFSSAEPDAALSSVLVAVPASPESGASEPETFGVGPNGFGGGVKL
jgi:hypothetical protein